MQFPVIYRLIFVDVFLSLLSYNTVRLVDGVDFIFVYDPLFKNQISPVKDHVRAAAAKYDNASEWKFQEIKSNDTLQVVREIAGTRSGDDALVVFSFMQQTPLLATLFPEGSLVLKYGVSASSLVS